MTQLSTDKPSSTSGTTGTTGSGSAPASRTGSAPTTLDSSQGSTTIASSVVQKIAGMAAREVSGVHAMGGGVSRAFGAIREYVPGGGSGSAPTSGVAVEVGERQAAVDLSIIVEYGAAITDLARAIRRNVIESVESMTGLDVVEVNIAVTDIHFPGADDDDDTPQQPARVE